MNTRIAITIEEYPQGEMLVANHFGRCSKIKVYDVDENKKVLNEESYLNPLQGNRGGTCQLPHYFQELGVNVVIAGGMGRKAISLFHSFNIEVVTAPGSRVNNALSGYLMGELFGYEECAGHKGEGH